VLLELGAGAGPVGEPQRAPGQRLPEAGEQLGRALAGRLELALHGPGNLPGLGVGNQRERLAPELRAVLSRAAGDEEDALVALLLGVQREGRADPQQGDAAGLQAGLLVEPELARADVDQMELLVIGGLEPVARRLGLEAGGAAGGAGGCCAAGRASASVPFPNTL